MKVPCYYTVVKHAEIIVVRGQIIYAVITGPMYFGAIIP